MMQTFGGFHTLPALPGKPLLLAQAAGALKVSAAPALSWKGDSSFIGKTHLVISVASDFSSPLLDTVFFDFDSVFAAKGLANDAKYYWRVRSENTAGAGPWSDAGSFMTIVSLPVTVTLVFPTPGDTLPADSAKALWHAASPKVDRYWVAVSPDSLFSTQLVDTTVTDTARLVRYSADAGTYWWK